jgi:hypothetical protein
MEFLKPWLAIGAEASRLEQELVAEVGPRHQLEGRPMRAIAIRQDCDDVLFVSADEPPLIAVVHLTYANRPESDPAWPQTTIFESMHDWIERGMKADHDDFFT